MAYVDEQWQLLVDPDGVPGAGWFAYRRDGTRRHVRGSVDEDDD